jgi:hypothetical protein
MTCSIIQTVYYDLKSLLVSVIKFCKFFFEICTAREAPAVVLY